MLNIFGALAQVSRLLPNYLEGQRQAVADNWRDLQQYNQAQAGQLQNLFTERVMPWRINMFGDAANTSRWQSYADTVKSMEYLMGSYGRALNAINSNITNPEQQSAAMAALNAQYGNILNPGLMNAGFAGMGQPLMQQQPMQQQPMPGGAEGTGMAKGRGTTAQATAAQDIPR